MRDVRGLLLASDRVAGVATNGLEMLEEGVSVVVAAQQPVRWHFTSYFDVFLCDVGGGEMGFYCFGMSEEEKLKWKESHGNTENFKSVVLAV